MGKRKMCFSNIINKFATKADFGAELNNIFFQLCSYEATQLKKSTEPILQL